MKITLYSSGERTWLCIVLQGKVRATHLKIKGVFPDQPEKAQAEAEALLTKRGVSHTEWKKINETCYEAEGFK